MRIQVHSKRPSVVQKYLAVQYWRKARHACLHPAGRPLPSIRPHGLCLSLRQIPHAKPGTCPSTEEGQSVTHRLSAMISFMVLVAPCAVKPRSPLLDLNRLVAVRLDVLNPEDSPFSYSSVHPREGMDAFVQPLRADARLVLCAHDAKPELFPATRSQFVC